jgi:carbonic anhydrase
MPLRCLGLFLLAEQLIMLGRLCELNVVRQLYNICTSPTVQAAWDRNQPITVHAFVYSLADGLLKASAHSRLTSIDLQ